MIQEWKSLLAVRVEVKNREEERGGEELLLLPTSLSEGASSTKYSCKIRVMEEERERERRRGHNDLCIVLQNTWSEVLFITSLHFSCIFTHQPALFHYSAASLHLSSTPHFIIHLPLTHSLSTHVSGLPVFFHLAFPEHSHVFLISAAMVSSLPL